MDHRLTDLEIMSIIKLTSRHASRIGQQAVFSRLTGTRYQHCKIIVSEKNQSSIPPSLPPFFFAGQARLVRTPSVPA